MIYENHIEMWLVDEVGAVRVCEEDGGGFGGGGGGEVGRGADAETFGCLGFVSYMWEILGGCRGAGLTLRTVAKGACAGRSTFETVRSKAEEDAGTGMMVCALYILNKYLNKGLECAMVSHSHPYSHLYSSSYGQEVQGRLTKVPSLANASDCLRL